MVCIEKRPHILYGRSSAPHFRYLTCLLDRGHIIATIRIVASRWFSDQTSTISDALSHSRYSDILYFLHLSDQIRAAVPAQWR